MGYADVFDQADDLEEERLELLCQTFDEGTFRRLDALDLRPGWRCLDIGAGTGSVARWLADRCGDVVATDLEIGSLRRRPHPGVQVLRHDVASDAFAEGSFDLIHARCVLMHLADRQPILNRVVRWLAPGGWLLLEDTTDFAIHSSPNPVYRGIWSAISRVSREDIGMDFDWARRFPQPLARAGLERLDVDVEASVVGPEKPMTGFLVHSQRRMQKLLLAGGSLDSELAEWRDTITRPGFWDLGLTNLAAWGQRPVPIPG